MVFNSHTVIRSEIDSTISNAMWNHSSYRICIFTYANRLMAGLTVLRSDRFHSNKIFVQTLLSLASHGSVTPVSIMINLYYVHFLVDKPCVIVCLSGLNITYNHTFTQNHLLVQGRASLKTDSIYIIVYNFFDLLFE